MTDMLTALIAREALPAAFAETVTRVWRPVAAAIAAWRHSAGRPVIIGINGVQGCGKSTACLFLAALLEGAHGLRTATLSGLAPVKWRVSVVTFLRRMAGNPKATTLSSTMAGVALSVRCSGVASTAFIYTKSVG